jgi:hypothetical protein
LALLCFLILHFLTLRQFEITYEGHKNKTTTAINYGQLEKILVCTLGQGEIWGSSQGKELLLVIITPFKTNGEDAALETTFYKNVGATLVTDIRNISSTIGRVESRGQWGIVDRAIDRARATFAACEEDPDLADDADEDSE